MGMIQSGFNQALTGATFLLQQTPMYKAQIEEKLKQEQIKKLDTKARSIIEQKKSVDEQLESGKDLEGKDLTDKQIAALKEKGDILQGERNLVNKQAFDIDSTSKAGQEWLSTEVGYQRAENKELQQQVKELNESMAKKDKAAKKLNDKYSALVMQMKNIKDFQERIKKEEHDETNRRILGGGN